jgi:hypothetical protein
MSALGMITTVLATGLTEAIYRDTGVTHGVPGVNVEAWVRETAASFTADAAMVLKVRTEIDRLMRDWREDRVMGSLGYSDLVALLALLEPPAPPEPRVNPFAGLTPMSWWSIGCADARKGLGTRLPNPNGRLFDPENAGYRNGYDFGKANP